MFSSPFFSPYSGGGNPFFCRPRQQPQYPREQYIDPFFSSLFPGMGVSPMMQPTPTRALACRNSTANLRAPIPERQLHRPQSTANMRAPGAGAGAGPVRRTPVAQSLRNPRNTQINHRPSQPALQVAAKKEPQYKTYETEEAYHILASLPEGVDKKSIDVRFLDDDMLVISGNVETETEVEIESETETETETEDESESDESDESEDDSEVESEVESESESEVGSESETESRSLQPYVEDVEDIDDPRTPRAKASLQIRRGSCSSASSRSSFASTNSANSANPANSARPLAKNKTQAKTSTLQLSKIQRTPKSSTPKRNTKRITKQTTTEKFSKKFQFPRPVEMRGVKARLEGDRLEIMVPKKRMVRVPPRMWYV
ncbi:hypothetical protein BZA77DRAFT_302837 [Pyronema omphalodes]|nr:hypothetical protein BZA77DRAFT_302837 [Pyronema omphalodes]